MTPAHVTRLRQLAADLLALCDEMAAEPRFTDDAGCFTGEPAPPRQPERPEPAQGLLPGMPPRQSRRRSAVHGWGVLSDETHPHPLRPGERVAVRVQTCRSCCARRRYGNTGVRLGARHTYQEAGGDTWSETMPACVPKG